MSNRAAAVCRPRALQAHDVAMGTGGAGLEATPPFVMKMLYGGAGRVRVVSSLRHPVDRLETAFWLHQVCMVPSARPSRRVLAPRSRTAVSRSPG